MPRWTDARAAAALIAALALAGPAWSQAPAPPRGRPSSSVSGSPWRSSTSSTGVGAHRTPPEASVA